MSRVAVVTGGASGMGEATCHELARRGHKVAVLDIDGQAAQRVCDDLRAEGATALAVAVDVSDRAVVEEAFAKVRTELGPVHILVTSAGLVDFAPFTEITVEAWDRLHRGEPDRDVPLLSGRGAGHGRGGLGSHRDDLVVERPAGFPEDGALRGQQGRAAIADQIACPRIRSGGHHGQQRSAVGHRDADAAPVAGGRLSCPRMSRWPPAFRSVTWVPATTSPLRSASSVRSRPASSQVKFLASTVGRCCDTTAQGRFAWVSGLNPRRAAGLSTTRNSGQGRSHFATRRHRSSTNSSGKPSSSARG